MFLDLGRRSSGRSSWSPARSAPFTQSPIDWDAAMGGAGACDSTITYRTGAIPRPAAARAGARSRDADDSNPRSLASSSFAPSTGISTCLARVWACTRRRFPDRSTTTSTPPCQPVRRRRTGRGGMRGWRFDAAATSRPIPITSSTSSRRRSPGPISPTCRRRRPSVLDGLSGRLS